jgi:hypothetical protein
VTVSKSKLSSGAAWAGSTAVAIVAANANNRIEEIMVVQPVCGVSQPAMHTGLRIKVSRTVSNAAG